jgi:hypothetical protein
MIIPRDQDRPRRPRSTRQVICATVRGHNGTTVRLYGDLILLVSGDRRNITRSRLASDRRWRNFFWTARHIAPEGTPNVVNHVTCAYEHVLKLATQP